MENDMSGRNQRKRSSIARSGSEDDVEYDEETATVVGNKKRSKASRDDSDQKSTQTTSEPITTDTQTIGDRENLTNVDEAIAKKKNDYAPDETSSNNKEQNAVGDGEVIYEVLKNDDNLKLDDTEVQQVEQRYYHVNIRITTASSSFIVREGDAVCLYNPSTPDDAGWICRVDGFYRTVHSGTNNDKNPAKSTKDTSNSTPSASGSTLSGIRMVGSWFVRPSELVRLSDFRFEKDKSIPSKPEESTTIETFLDNMKPNEVILTNLQEEHDIATIVRKCEFENQIYNDSDAKNRPLKHLSCRYELKIDANEQCVTWLDYRTNSTKVSVVDDGSVNETSMSNKGTTALGKQESASTIHNSITSASLIPRESKDETSTGEDEQNNMNEENSSHSILEETPRSAVQDSEGSVLRGDIAVGSKYQVKVKPFNPDIKPKIVSRNPKLVWNPRNELTQEEFQGFLDRVSYIHNQFLKENNLIILDEPYSPLPQDRAEKFLLENMEMNRRYRTSFATEDNDHSSDTKAYNFLIGSHMSTSSMLGVVPESTDFQRCGLLRECDSDNLLGLLCENNFNIDDTIQKIQENPYLITTAWQKRERDIFDAGYRLNPPSALRDIWKALPKGTKDTKDLVDYHYRFKIPDQFRKYQDKKREQAIRMLEIIEKRNANALDNVTNASQQAHPSTKTTQNGIDSTEAVSSTRLVIRNPNVKGGTKAKDTKSHSKASPALSHSSQNNSPYQSVHWSEKTISSVLNARDERMRSAKQLLMDVKDTLGRDTMKSVAAVVKKLHSSDDAETRNALFLLLPNQLDLQKRFLEFLPQRYS